MSSARRLARLFALLLWLWASPLVVETLNLDSEVKVSFSELVFDLASDTFDTTATITNTSEEVLLPPISLVLIAIVPNSVSLANATGQRAGL